MSAHGRIGALKMNRLWYLLVLLLALTAIYLYALPSATLSYAFVTSSHAGLGILLTVALCFLFLRLREEPLRGRLGWICIAPGAHGCIALIYQGTPHRFT